MRGPRMTNGNWHQIWVEQCAAAETIKLRFGLKAAFDYAGARGLGGRAVVPNHRQGGSAVQGFRLNSWSRPRRVVGKPSTCPTVPIRASWSSLGREKIDARGLYEDLYCARGEMENRMQQLDLFADRTSSATMQANQLRLWFASMAYVLLNELRRIALRHTQFADATCGTIRLKLLKIGALVRRSVRRIKFAMASGFPWQNEFALAYLYLQRAFPR